jgi:hypothetical protein
MKRRSRVDDLKAEYDFANMSGGVRGKYAKAYRAGTNIVVLADDVASAFPTDDAVNRALRAVMDLAGAVPRGRKPSNSVLQPPAPRKARARSVPSRSRRRG